MMNYTFISVGRSASRRRLIANDRAVGFDMHVPSSWQLIIPLSVEPKPRNNSFFLQDSWRAASNFTINAGVRWERQQLGDRFDEYVLDLTDNWAPRIGGVWDF